MCALTEQVIFTEPYTEAENNRRTTPQRDASRRQHFARTRELKSAICALKSTFACDAAALLHGDLHTGSIMCTESTTFVIDHEFAFYGPMGFDVAAFLANVLMALLRPGRLRRRAPRSRSRLLECLVGHLDRVRGRFIQLGE